jgi:choice-of-anchor B domain-containing protein
MNLIGTLDPQSPENYNDIWGYESGGTFIAIIGVQIGTSFIDVTNPALPVEVFFLPGVTSSWRDMKVWQNYAYIVTEGGGGMQIVDLTDPLNPVHVNTWNDTFSSAHNIYIDTGEGIAYVFGTNNGTRILDLTGNPVNPVEVGSFTTRYVHDGYAADGLLCLSEINNGQQEILDTTDKMNLQSLALFPTPQGSTHNCWADDSWSLLVTSDEVSSGGYTNLYDISDLNNVIHRSSYQPSTTTSVHNAMFDNFDNERVWLSHYAIGIQMIDAHRPSAPVTLGYYDTYPSNDSGFNGNWGVYPYDSRGYAYVSDRATGLYVVEYAPTGGTLSGVVRDADTGSPLAGVTVTELNSGSSTVSAADGVFATYADAGPIRLRATQFGYTTAIVSAADMILDGRRDVDIEMKMIPTGSFGGTITRADNAQPLADVLVKLRDTPIETVTDGTGAYQFQDVPVGGRVLLVDRFGFDLQSARVTLHAGANPDVDLALEPARLADDAETDQGWMINDPTDTARLSGRWFLADPNGTGNGTAQPENDHTDAPGVQAWHTGPTNPGAGVELGDVDLGFTTLTSPLIDASGLGEVEVSYWRWLSRNAGPIPGGSLFVEISADDGLNWTALETLLTNANAWTESRFDIDSVIAPSSQMRIRFRADSGFTPPDQSVVEAAVDDFVIRAACDGPAYPQFADADLDDSTDGCDPCPLDPLDDLDGDGLCADVDNAPFDANPGQQDGDADTVGDAGDNCPADANAGQRDLDRDGLGDACDDDIDGDGQLNAADSDDDNDGVSDASDNCPAGPNATQQDRDADGVGDRCDDDDGLVQGVWFDDVAMHWIHESGADGYNVYRAALGAPELLPLADCYASSIQTDFVIDRDSPELGEGFSYLVVRTVSGVEGPLGEDSSGAPRTVDSVCP